MFSHLSKGVLPLERIVFCLGRSPDQLEIGLENGDLANTTYVVVPCLKRLLEKSGWKEAWLLAISCKLGAERDGGRPRYE